MSWQAEEGQGRTLSGCWRQGTGPQGTGLEVGGQQDPTPSSEGSGDTALVQALVLAVEQT